MPLALSVAGFTAILVAWLGYLARIPKEKVPVRPVGTLALLAVGVVLVAVALGLGAKSGLSGGVTAISASAGALALFFVYLLRQAPLPDGELVVSVGDRLPAFEALDGDNNRFDSATLAQKRILLKFFRGSW